MSKPSHLDINEELRQLQREYIGKLPSRMQVLEQAWQAYITQAKPEYLQDIYRRVHAITGTSGVLGIDEVSDAARAIEQAVRDRRQKDSLTSTETKAIQAYIEILSNLARSSEIKVRTIDLGRR